MFPQFIFTHIEINLEYIVEFSSLLVLNIIYTGALVDLDFVNVEKISLSHGRYFRQFWGTATFTSESLHTARCYSLYP